jgi:hypothetical protein
VAVELTTILGAARVAVMTGATLSTCAVRVKGTLARLPLTSVANTVQVYTWPSLALTSAL